MDKPTTRALVRGEEIQKSESGEGKKFDKIELYLPVIDLEEHILTVYDLNTEKQGRSYLYLFN